MEQNICCGQPVEQKINSNGKWQSQCRRCFTRTIECESQEADTYLMKILIQEKLN